MKNQKQSSEYYLNLDYYQHRLNIAKNVGRVINMATFQKEDLEKRILKELPKDIFSKIDSYIIENDIYNDHDKLFFKVAGLPYENGCFHSGKNVVLLGFGEYLLRNKGLISFYKNPKD